MSTLFLGAQTNTCKYINYFCDFVCDLILFVHISAAFHRGWTAYIYMLLHCIAAFNEQLFTQSASLCWVFKNNNEKLHFLFFCTANFMSGIFMFCYFTPCVLITIRYDTRCYVLTCARKPTWISLIYCKIMSCNFMSCIFYGPPFLCPSFSVNPLKLLIISVVNKDLTFKANAKDSKFVLEDTSRPRTKAKDKNTADNCHPLENSCKLCEPVAIWATKRLYRFA